MVVSKVFTSYPEALHVDLQSGSGWTVETGSLKGGWGN